jgi:predicted GIY-YIG superfamily endonuclease
MITYLIHFDQPYKHARHYTGKTKDLPARLKKHREGSGARLLAVLNEQGIGWEVARTWEGDCEKALKARHDAARYCPVCGGRRRKPITRERDTIMNNDDERDHAEEAYNRELLHTGDGEIGDDGTHRAELIAAGWDRDPGDLPDSDIEPGSPLGQMLAPLHTGDGESGEGPGAEALPPMTNERIYADLKAYADAGMIDYVLPTEPLGEQWIVGWRGQILKFTTTEGIIGFLVGIQAATIYIARGRGIDTDAFLAGRTE